MEKSTYSVWSNSKFMMGIAWGTKKSLLILVGLLAVLQVGASLLGLFIAPRILEAVEQGAPLNEFIMVIVSFVVPLTVVEILITYLSSVISWAKVDCRVGIVQKIIQKYWTTSYSNTLKKEVREKLQQSAESNGGNQSATEVIYVTFQNIVRNLLGFVIYLFLLQVLDPFTISVVVFTTVGGFFLSRNINEWGYRRREEEATYHKQLNYVVMKTADNRLAKDVRLFGMGDWLKSVYASGFNLYRGFLARREKMYLWADVLDLALALLRNGIAYLYLVRLMMLGQLSAGSFLLYFTAVGGFTAWVTGILEEFSILHKQSLELSIIREFLDYPEPFAFDIRKPLAFSQKYELELKNVSFRYEGAEENTLENINLVIKPGEKLAIVGINGAGKTTLVKLLCGFLDPTAGEVLLNGVNIKTYNRQQYYELFSAVFQDFSVMAGSVAENIAQKVAGIDLKRVEMALKKAGLEEKVRTFPNGLETKLCKEVYEDAVDLSGGQMQRLMLARALYKEGPILVLDEPTAALDPIAESEIYQAYDQLTEGKTAIYISHRLASTGFCDRIILLDGKSLAEEGTHHELLALGGQYAEMFEIQSRYYQENLGEAGGADEA